MEQEICDIVVSGLKVYYNEIPPELSKKLLANVWQHLLLTGETTLPPKPEAKNSHSSDLIKQAEFAAVTFLCLAAKHDWDDDRIRDFLSGHNCNPMFIDAVLEKNLDNLGLRAKLFGHSIPYTSNISWQMTCETSTGQLLYKINLEKMSNTGGKQSLVQFTCNPEELIALIGRLKEIERHLIHTSA